jgi:hypothetical protein
MASTTPDSWRRSIKPRLPVRAATSAWLVANDPTGRSPFATVTNGPQSRRLSTRLRWVQDTLTPDRHPTRRPHRTEWARGQSARWR